MVSVDMYRIDDVTGANLSEPDSNVENGTVVHVRRKMA